MYRYISILCLLAIQNAYSQTNYSDRAVFVAAVDKEWKSINLQVSGSNRSDSTTTLEVYTPGQRQPRSIQKSSNTFKRGQNAVSLFRTIKLNDFVKTSDVELYNSAYSANLARITENSHLLNRVSFPANTEYEKTKQNLSKTDYFEDLLCVSFDDILYSSLEKLISDSKCNVDIVHVGSAVKVKFYQAKGSKYVESLITFDTLNHMSPVSSELLILNNNKLIERRVITKQFSISKDSITHTAENLLYAQSASGESLVMKSFGEDVILTPTVDQSEFRLSFYGLPEPEGVVWEKPIPSYVWYLSIAGGALVLFFIAGWLLKRRAKARAVTTTTTSALPKPPAGSG
jgi:hypothetical protein